MQFPIIIIPKSFKWAKEKTPKLPPEPLKPIQPDTSLSGCSLWIFIGTFSFSMLLIGFGNNGSNNSINENPEMVLIFNIIGLVSLIPIFIWLYSNKKKRTIKKTIYENELKVFPNIMEEYNQKIQEIMSSKNLLNFREQELKKVIQLSTSANYLKKSVNKGRYEDLFFTYLTNFFPENIIINVSLGHFENPYVPDFVFVDKSTGLHIDIEIDEPYVLNTKEPIHFVGSDARRNLFFEENNWVVLRFAEEQVAKQPLSCCITIANIVNEITGNSSYLSKMKNIEEIKPVECWTREDSLFLGKQNYRETY